MLAKFGIFIEGQDIIIDWLPSFFSSFDFAEVVGIFFSSVFAIEFKFRKNENKLCGPN